MGKRYSPEYKEEAMKLVKEIGRRETVQKLGVTEWTINEWQKKAAAAKREESNVQTNNLRRELREAEEKIGALEKEISRIRKENEFLEEASRFFASSRQR